MKRIANYLFGRDVWHTRIGVIAAGMFLSLIWFNIVWSMGTTFRAMSDWMLYSVNILAALILTVPYALTRKVWVAIIFMLVADGFCMANLMYCRTYFTAIPLDSYGLASNLNRYTSTLWDSLRLADVGFLVILIFTVLLAYRLPKPSSWKPTLRFLASIPLMAVIVSIGILCRGGFYNEYDRLTQSCRFYTCGVPTYTIAGHLIYNAMCQDTEITPERLSEIETWMAEHSRLMPYTPLTDTIAGPPRTSMVLILCESLESWALEKDIDGKPITPFLNSLIADSTTLYAPNMQTQVAQGRSIDCQLMLNSGLLPMLTQVYSMKYPLSTYPTINKAMKQATGAKSMIFTTVKPISWNQDGVVRAFGYDSLLHRGTWELDEQVGNPPMLSDGSFMRQSVAKLKEGELWPVGEPRMLTFVTYSGHNPFRLPDNLKDPDFDVSGLGLPEKMADYITMAHYTDSKIAQLVDYVRSRPDYSNTIIVIIGDHEGLASDRADILKSPKAEGIVSAEQFTPFIVLNSPVPGRIDKIVGQIDMYPTLLQLMRLDSYPWRGQGQSILESGKPSFAISSLTNAIVGDTTNIDQDLFEHISRARRVSDDIISHNLLEGKD